MILADLFKPNKYGTPAIVTTISGDVLKQVGDRCYLRSSYKVEEYHLSTNIIPYPKTKAFTTDRADGSSDFLVLKVLYLQPATPENLLIALTLEHQ